MRERVQDRRYLLDIGELLGPEGERLAAEAFRKVDAERGGKARRMKSGSPRAACLGAGLLLQLAVREALEGRMAGGFPRYTVSQLLERLPAPLPLTYRYGENGKPYFREYPFYFNLSHSGSYVLCALSAQEIGVDIQQHRACGAGRLAGRFFPAEECAALEVLEERDGAERDDFFFRLWARKEAYGKLTGRGIAGAVGVCLLPDGEELSGAEEPPDVEKVPDIGRLPAGRALVWEESDAVCGYSIAVCRYFNQ